MLFKLWKKSLVANGVFKRTWAINIAFIPYMVSIENCLYISKYKFKNPLLPNSLITAYTIKIDGITNEKPHNEIMIFTIFKFFLLFKANEKGIAIKQLIIADKKAWNKEKYINL